MCSVMDVFNNEDAVVIVLHRTLIELLGILKFIEGIFRTLPSSAKPLSGHSYYSTYNSTAI